MAKMKYTNWLQRLPPNLDGTPCHLSFATMAVNTDTGKWRFLANGFVPAHWRKWIDQHKLIVLFDELHDSTFADICVERNVDKPFADWFSQAMVTHSGDFFGSINPER